MGVINVFHRQGCNVRLVRRDDGVDLRVILPKLAHDPHPPSTAMLRARWADLVPPPVADKQATWERRQMMLRMRNLGYMKHEIAWYFSNSLAAAFQDQGTISPVRLVLTGGPDTVDLASNSE